jgi:hypothetical protein
MFKRCERVNEGKGVSEREHSSEYMYLRHNSNNVVRSNGFTRVSSLLARAQAHSHKELWVCNANKCIGLPTCFEDRKILRRRVNIASIFLQPRMGNILNYRIVTNVWGQCWVKAPIFTKFPHAAKALKEITEYWTGNHRFHDSSCKRAEKWYKKEENKIYLISLPFAVFYFFLINFCNHFFFQIYFYRLPF